MSARRSVRVRAFAKINATLHVLGVRADRYHELRTTFQSIALHDTLTFTAQPGPFRLECDDPACPSDRANLVWHAAERVWRAASRGGVPRDVVARVAKRIPTQAGLGGGSSDAAATLRALDALWRVRMSREQMRSIASEIGADVPFFLEGGTTLGLERGDLLFPLLDAPASWVVLAIPDFGVSTTEAYAWFDRDRKAVGLRRRRTAVGAGNDLQAVVSRRHPEIRRLVSVLRRRGASHAALSGSGSAVFGLFGSRAAAASTARALASRTRRTLVTRTLDRAKYVRLARLVSG
jgi:4-diphosphocytidyl-2-C-methyl-D-erythritol kinase